jgi:heme oxygenase (biliverdin-IX-beta and delta-forming)
MTFEATNWTSDDGALFAERSSLREILRHATLGDQAALDRALARLDLAARGDLAQFLGIQLASRAGIERWLEDSSPPDWVPPPQTGLIADDLAALGSLPRAYPAPRFEPGPDADWLGPAYVVAVSHLGNRLLLAQAGPALPREARRFLTGNAMQDYARRLRRLLGEAPGPSGAAAAIAAARAAFAHFRDCVGLFARATRARA